MSSRIVVLLIALLFFGPMALHFLFYLFGTLYAMFRLGAERSEHKKERRNP
jgi:Sec-independent protein translocase protein TatA